MFHPRVAELFMVVWWSGLTLSGALDKALPCQVYTTEPVGTTLPTLLSFRPFTTNWTFDLHFRNQHTALIWCMRLKADHHHVSVTHNSGICRHDVPVTTRWPTDAFGPTFQTVTYIRHNDDKLELYIKSRSSPSVVQMSTKPAGRLHVSLATKSQMSYSYNCPATCSTSITTSKEFQLLKTFEKSSTFFILPRQTSMLTVFNASVHGTSCVNKMFSDQINRNLLNKKLSYKKDMWNRLDVFFNNGIYQILLNGEELCGTCPKHVCHLNFRVNVFITGNYSWSVNCDPRQLKTESLITESTKNTITTTFESSTTNVTTTSTTPSTSVVNSGEVDSIIMYSTSVAVPLALILLVCLICLCKRSRRVAQTSALRAGVAEGVGVAAGGPEDLDQHGGNIDTCASPPAPDRLLHIGNFQSSVDETSKMSHPSAAVSCHMLLGSLPAMTSLPRPQVGSSLDAGSPQQDKQGYHIYNGAYNATCQALRSPSGIKSATSPSVITCFSGQQLSGSPLPLITHHDSINSLYSPVEALPEDRSSQHIYEEIEGRL
nr:uncharacterized protein LOC123770991 [Procambarus clarkii]